MPHPPHSDHDDSALTANEGSTAARRRAILKGLGKGGAVLGAAMPISSYARVRTTNNKQCTVSGQMSAVMSQAASVNPCAAYHPTYFFSSSAYKSYKQWDNGTGGNAAATFANALKNLAVGGYYFDSSGTTPALYFKKNLANTEDVRQLLPLNRPANYNGANLLTTGVFSSATSDYVLKILHGSSGSDLAYFLAAFFSAELAKPAGNFEKVPFPGTDVQSQWSGAKKAEAATLYRLVCTLNDGSAAKLG